jgi:RNA polymerase sigma-70 factor (ECF subfamily)
MGNSKHLSDKNLIDKCIAKDPESQRILYDKFSNKMYAVCLRYATDRDHAKDLLQDGFIRVFKSLPKYQYKGSFDGWVRRVFVNCSIENYRRNKKGKYFQELTPQTEKHVNPDVLQNLRMEELLKLINALPVGYKTVFNMYVIDGYSHKEISEELKITESTSKTQLRKARLALMEKIETLEQK